MVVVGDGVWVSLRSNCWPKRVCFEQTVLSLSLSCVSLFTLPNLQLLRLAESTGLLAKSAAKCIEDNDFRRTYRPFCRVRDCECVVPDGEPLPTPPLPDVWARDHESLEREGEYAVVCSRCRTVDQRGTHDPGAM